VLARLGSLLALALIWQVAAHFANPRLLPGPLAVLDAIVAQTASGALPRALAATLARVAAAFALSMAAGSALGYAMGRRASADRWLDAPLVVLLNLPALVIIVLAYIWIGLNEAAAIVAVALNKLPNAVVTLREGARTLDRDLDEMAAVFGFSAVKRWRHVVLPQLAPFFAAATRSGLSLVWKIVLVVELLGRPNGVGFEIGTAFQLFDVATLLAYALPFTAIMLAIETFLVQPFERHAARWRPRAA
jgi:NitT/TauT family transport system permease protein